MYPDQLSHNARRASPMLFLHNIGVLVFIASCRLLITFANSSDPDQARQNVLLNLFFEQIDYEKISRRQIKKGFDNPIIAGVGYIL